MNFQTSTSTIGANWFGFGDDVLFFEWSIISDSFRIPSTSLNSQGCYEDLRVIKPDVMHWELLKKNTFSSIKSNLSLQEGQKYYVLVRATYRSGHQIIAISDGVYIIPSTESPDSFYNFKTKESAPISDDTFTTTTRKERGAPLESILRPGDDFVRTRSTISTARCSDPYYATCSIDNDNRCTQDDRKRVSNYLNLIYGKASFPVSEPLPPIIRVGPSPPEDDGADDDDSQSPAWILAPVLGFIFLIFLLCLCLICCVFICVNCLIRSNDEDGADIGPLGDDDNEKEYGNRGGVNKADTTTNTKVEFPDTNIRRLSVDHNDEEEVNEEVKGTRRKHPIATSASSSFRDYRAAN